MRRYKEFVERVEVKNLEDPGRELAGGFILGDSYFVQWVKETFLGKRAEERQIPQLRRLKLARLYFSPMILATQGPSRLSPPRRHGSDPNIYLLTGCCPNPFSLCLKRFLINLRLASGDSKTRPLGSSS